MIGTLITKTLAFDAAYDAAKNAKLIARAAWNGSNRFVFMRPQDDLPYMVLLSAKSIPNAVKDYYIKKAESSSFDQLGVVTFSGYLCMKDADDNIENGWTPSTIDVLAEDWFIINSY